jgi:hypothetical protein
MFISKAEKESIHLKIRALEARVRDLEIEAVWLKNKSTKTRNPIVRTEEAPWGLKKDGNPRKRPGRPVPTMEVGS